MRRSHSTARTLFASPPTAPFDIELDLLALFEVAVALALDRRVMDNQKGLQAQKSSPPKSLKPQRTDQEHTTTRLSQQSHSPATPIAPTDRLANT
jgi:hypothetical protein